MRGALAAKYAQAYTSAAQNPELLILGAGAFACLLLLCACCRCRRRGGKPPATSPALRQRYESRLAQAEQASLLGAAVGDLESDLALLESLSVTSDERPLPNPDDYPDDPAMQMAARLGLERAVREQKRLAQMADA